MSELGNKEIFSKNLRLYMEKAGKDRTQICDDLGFKYTTFADWYMGNPVFMRVSLFYLTLCGF